MGVGREARTKPYAVLAQPSCVCCFLAVPKSTSSQQTELLANETGNSTCSAENLEGIRSPWWQVVKAQSTTEAARASTATLIGLSLLCAPLQPGWRGRTFLTLHSSLSWLLSHWGPVLLRLPCSRAAQVTGAGLGKKWHHQGVILFFKDEDLGTDSING